MSDAQRGILESLAKSQTAAHREVTRAKALLLAADVVLPALNVLTGVVIGSGQGSKSTTTPAATASASKAPGWPDLSALASSAGITENQLNAGLIAAKQAGGNSTAAVAGFARATGVSPAAA